MKLRNNFDSLGAFQGFSCWLPRSQEWSTSADYKTVVLAYRRSSEDRRANPIQSRRVAVAKHFAGEERRA